MAINVTITKAIEIPISAPFEFEGLSSAAAEEVVVPGGRVPVVEAVVSVEEVVVPGGWVPVEEVVVPGGWVPVEEIVVLEGEGEGEGVEAEQPFPSVFSQ